MPGLALRGWVGSERAGGRQLDGHLASDVAACMGASCILRAQSSGAQRRALLLSILEEYSRLREEEDAGGTEWCC